MMVKLPTLNLASIDSNFLITGTYIDNYNRVFELVQKGDKITGRNKTRDFTGSGAVVKGTITGNTIELTIDPEFGTNGKATVQVFNAGKLLKGKIKMRAYQSTKGFWELKPLN